VVLDEFLISVNYFTIARTNFIMASSGANITVEGGRSLTKAPLGREGDPLMAIGKPGKWRFTLW
jgi:hypothetical protein